LRWELDPVRHVIVRKGLRTWAYEIGQRLSKLGTGSTAIIKALSMVNTKCGISVTLRSSGKPAPAGTT
jgi:hypothetical protein